MSSSGPTKEEASEPVVLCLEIIGPWLFQTSSELHELRAKSPRKEIEEDLERMQTEKDKTLHEGH